MVEQKSSYVLNQDQFEQIYHSGIKQLWFEDEGKKEFSSKSYKVFKKGILDQIDLEDRSNWKDNQSLERVILEAATRWYLNIQ